MTDALRWFLDGLVAHVERGEFTLPLLLVLLGLLGPLGWAWWWRCFVLRKVEHLYQDIIKEKDAEIARILKVYGGRKQTSTAGSPSPPVEKLPFTGQARP